MWTGILETVTAAKNGEKRTLRSTVDKREEQRGGRSGEIYRSCDMEKWSKKSQGMQE